MDRHGEEEMYEEVGTPTGAIGIGIEESFEGVGEVEREKKRKRSRSVGSPVEMKYQVRKGVISEGLVIQEFCKEISVNLEEIESYTKRTLVAKDNRHEKYIIPRITQIRIVQDKWVEECKKVAQLDWIASKVASIEREVIKAKNIVPIG